MPGRAPSGSSASRFSPPTGRDSGRFGGTATPRIRGGMIATASARTSRTAVFRKIFSYNEKKSYGFMASVRIFSPFRAESRCGPVFGAPSVVLSPRSGVGIYLTAPVNDGAAASTLHLGCTLASRVTGDYLRPIASTQVPCILTVYFAVGNCHEAAGGKAI